ncbi:MAG: hypothetical protein ABIP65_03650 [Vicinamibacterales bacterium]
MTTRTYGLLAGVIGFGAWWYSRHRATAASPARQRGTVIFDNTPTPTALSDQRVM